MTTYDGDRQFYRWRQMTDEQRKMVLMHRQLYQYPWHSPKHVNSESGLYLVTAACYEHQSIIGHSRDRMLEFEQALIETCKRNNWELFAWIVLPNHYHLLLRSPDAKSMICKLGQLHGRTSYLWNGEENRRGRKVWFNAMETGIKSEDHFHASLLYVLNNAVKHGYVDRWQDWPYSNAREWLQQVGRNHAVQAWNKFPLENFGRDWDPPEL